MAKWKRSAIPVLHHHSIRTENDLWEGLVEYAKRTGSTTSREARVAIRQYLEGARPTPVPNEWDEV